MNYRLHLQPHLSLTLVFGARLARGIATWGPRKIFLKCRFWFEVGMEIFTLQTFIVVSHLLPSTIRV